MGALTPYTCPMHLLTAALHALPSFLPPDVSCTATIQRIHSLPPSLRHMLPFSTCLLPPPCSPHPPFQTPVRVNKLMDFSVHPSSQRPSPREHYLYILFTKIRPRQRMLFPSLPYIRSILPPVFPLFALMFPPLFSSSAPRPSPRSPLQPQYGTRMFEILVFRATQSLTITN